MQIVPWLTQQARQRGQALVELVLLFAIIAIFGHWVVQYFTEILTLGGRRLGFNLTGILMTGAGW